MTKRGMKMVLFAATLISVLPTNVGVASAKVLRWDLQDVTLPDGSTNIGAAASGYFLFDTATHAVVGWDIDVEGSIPPYPGRCGPPQAAWQCFPAYRFIPPNSRLVGPLYGPFLSIPNENQALLDWSRADGNDFGDPVGRQNMGFRVIVGTSSFDFPGVKSAHAREYWTYMGGDRRDDGRLVAVPEPAGILFLALGLFILMGFCVRRKLL